MGMCKGSNGQGQQWACARAAMGMYKGSKLSVCVELCNMDSEWQLSRTAEYGLLQCRAWQQQAWQHGALRCWQMQ